VAPVIAAAPALISAQPATKPAVAAPVAASTAPVAPVAPAEPVAIPEYRVFMSRSQEPKPEAPITYRELACAVPPGTSREAVDALLRECWQAVRAELTSHPSGQLVQIAIFDHAFEQRPQRPPLGTLAWKDWRGDPVIGFPGFGVPSPPVSASMPPPASPRAPTEGEAASAERAAAAPAATEAAPAAQAPSQETRLPVPGRRRAGEDLISELFELMHELHFARDIVTGAEFVLGVLAEVIPSEYTMVSVFNINTRKFVVVRAHGPGAQASVLHSTPDNDPLISELMHRAGARAFKAEGDSRFAVGRFASFKYPLEQVLCGPVRQGGRYLGIIELGNPLGGKPFRESEINALDYICEQFADFVASRPVVLDPDVILGR
jgi:hypothetical protein